MGTRRVDSDNYTADKDRRFRTLSQLRELMLPENRNLVNLALRGKEAFREAYNPTLPIEKQADELWERLGYYVYQTLLSIASERWDEAEFNLALAYADAREPKGAARIRKVFAYHASAIATGTVVDRHQAIREDMLAYLRGAQGHLSY